MRNLIMLLLITTACQGQPVDFSESQVAEDINYLRTELERFHPGLYRYTPKAKMDLFFKEAAKTSEGLAGTDLYTRVTFLLSQVRCGHTRTSMPVQMRQGYIDRNRFLPFHIQLLGEEAFIAASLNPAIPKGAILRSIDGKAYSDIERLIFDHIAADGFIETNKRRKISWFFPFYYQLYLDESSAAMEVEYEVEGVSRKVKVDRVGYAETESISSYGERNTELRLEHSKDFSFMRISTFGQQSLNAAGLDYENFLRESFSEIKSNQVKNLILDLRGNGGGRDNYGALLVSYLLPKEFGYFDNIKVTPDYTGYGGVMERQGKRFVTNHQGLSRWEPQKDVFKGNLYVLIDGGSFSTCADVATVLHHNKRGVFLGEETGGGYDGNTSGNTRTITLPNSGIRVFVPLWMYTTANLGHRFEGCGVMPDHHVFQSWRQFTEKNDVVVNRAIELIRK